MKKKSVIMFSVLFVGILFLVTGCFNKTSITAKEFKDKMEGLNYQVLEATEQFSDYDYVKKVYLAIDYDKNYQVEFYQLSDVENAINFYNNNKGIFEDGKGKKYSETNNSGQNYEKYRLKTNDKYKVISRIDNTVVFINVDDDLEKSIDDLLKELGY